MKRLMIALAVAALASSVSHAADLGGKLLKVGSDTTSPPMESIDPATGQVVGFDVDVVNAVCAKINCQAEFITTGWDGIFAALDQGNFDLVASGVSITEERKKAMDFSDPYIVNSQAVLMRVEDQGITLDRFKDAGRKLSAQANTTDAQVAESVVGKENVAAYDTFSAAIIVMNTVAFSRRLIRFTASDSSRENVTECAAPLNVCTAGRGRSVGRSSRGTSAPTLSFQ